MQMLLDADSVEQTLDDSLHWLGQLLPTPPTINFPWLDELTATAKAKKDGVTQFYESRIAQGFYSAAQAAGVGDLTPGGFAVKWEELAIIGDGGVRLKAVVAYPKAGAAEAARFPVVVLCNSWVMNWWEYAVKQQEWAAAGYVVLMYVARGWWESEGEVTAAGPLEAPPRDSRDAAERRGRYTGGERRGRRGSRWTTLAACSTRSRRAPPTGTPTRPASPRRASRTAEASLSSRPPPTAA